MITTPSADKGSAEPVEVPGEKSPSVLSQLQDAATIPEKGTYNVQTPWLAAPPPKKKYLGVPENQIFDIFPGAT